MNNEIIDILNVITLSLMEDYIYLKQQNCWEIYLSGVVYGIYNMSDKSMDIEEIYNYLEESVINGLN